MAVMRGFGNPFLLPNIAGHFSDAYFRLDAANFFSNLDSAIFRCYTLPRLPDWSAKDVASRDDCAL